MSHFGDEKLAKEMEKSTLAEETLELKKGVEVIFISNDSNDR